MSRPRTKSSDVTLPPAVSKASKDRLEAMKKIYSRPQTTLRASRSLTTNGNHLPELNHPRIGSSFARQSTSQDRLPSAFGKSRLQLLNGSRGKSESRYGSALFGRVENGRLDYGRSESMEKINDLRDQLHETKKINAQLENERRILKTSLHRLARESDKREHHLQRLVIGKFQPAEFNDTQMAKTWTMITQNQIGNEQKIRVQKLEIENLKEQLRQKTGSTVSGSEANSRPKITYVQDFDTEEDDDYPQEPDNLRTPESIRPSTSKQKIQFKDPIEKERRERNKKRIEIAKAYALQNAKLKERLQKLKDGYIQLQKKNKTHKENISALKANEQARALEETVEKTKMELAEDQVNQKDAVIKEKNELITILQEKLNAANVTVVNTKIENEHLQQQLAEAEEKMRALNSQIEELKIPKLDMSKMDSNDRPLSPIYQETDRYANISKEIVTVVMMEKFCSHVGRISGLKAVQKK